MKRFALALVSAVASVAVTQAQWPQWRGPDRTGLVPAAAVPAAWPDKPTVKWTQPVGEGYSSPVVDDQRVFVHSRTDPDEVVSAFELDSGEPIWSATYGSSFTKNKYAAAMAKGPFSTPLVANGRLFTLGTSAVLSSFDAATGAVKWRKDWSKEIDTSGLFTGTAMSPIIDSGLLIVHVGDDGAGAHARARSGDRRREVDAPWTWTWLCLTDRDDVWRRPPAGDDERQGGGGDRGAVRQGALDDPVP